MQPIENDLSPEFFTLLSSLDSWVSSLPDAFFMHLPICVCVWCTLHVLINIRDPIPL